MSTIDRYYETMAQNNSSSTYGAGWSNDRHDSSGGRSIVFRNPSNGDVREYRYSHVAYFFFGVIYLVYLGYLRVAGRPVLSLACPIGVYLLLRDLPSLATFGNLLIAVTAIICLVIHIYFLVKSPSKIVRELFVTGYAPVNEDERKALVLTDILSSGRIRSYSAAYEGDR